MIHHVIVQKCGGMDVFDHPGEERVVRAGIAGEPGAKNQEERADTLPAAAENVRRDDIDERDFGIEVLPDLIFDGGHLTPIAVPDVFNPLKCARVGADRHPRILGKPRGDCQANGQISSLQSAALRVIGTRSQIP